MGIRVATISDLDLVLDLGKKFLNETNYKQFGAEDKLEQLAKYFLTSPASERIVFLYDDVGILGASVSPFIFGDMKVATDILWWVEPTRRGDNIGTELIKAYEYWAKTVGCRIAVMVSLDERVGKFYEKNGYALYERAYMKELK
jgi:GNAT superfamily N-acetyltransferase